MKRLLTICAVVGFIMAVASTVQAVLDVNTIVMTSCKDFLDGDAETNPWNFEIWVELDGTGTLHHIDVTLPAGGLPDFTIYDGHWEYDSNDYLTLAALQDDYPTGGYLFSFEDSGDAVLRTFTLDYNGLSEPLGPVDFTYPADDGATDVPLDPTYEWTIDSGDGDALGMWVWDPVADEDKYGDVPVSMDTNSWQPGSLLSNHTYELEVSVFGVKDGEAGPSLPTKMIDGDTFAYGLLIEHINMIEFTTVPEPATIALLGLGSLLLSRHRRFNKK